MLRKIGLPILVVLLALAAVGALMIPRGGPQPALAGTVLPGRVAPGFHLKDQFGHTLDVTQFRGKPVILTFMDASCLQLCPIVAETIRRAVAELGPEGKRVAILVVSTAPEDDTPAVVQRFSITHHMLHRWHFLTAARTQLGPLWARYYIYAAPRGAPASVRDAHTSATYLIDGQGRERVLMGGAPDIGAMVRDLRILSGLPATGHAFAVPAPQTGHPSPAFALHSLGGAPISLSALKGHVVLLNFWATWCTACKSEMPMLSGWYRQYRSQGLIVLGVDQGDSSGATAQYTAQLHIPYPVVLDGDGTVSARYNVIGLPTSYLIDRTGVIRSVKLGIVGRSYLASRIRPLLAGRSAG